VLCAALLAPRLPDVAVLPLWLAVGRAAGIPASLVVTEFVACMLVAVPAASGIGMVATDRLGMVPVGAVFPAGVLGVLPLWLAVGSATDTPILLVAGPVAGGAGGVAAGRPGVLPVVPMVPAGVLGVPPVGPSLGEVAGSGTLGGTVGAAGGALVVVALPPPQ